VKAEAEEPEDEKYDDNCPKHVSSPELRRD